MRDADLLRETLAAYLTEAEGPPAVIAAAIMGQVAAWFAGRCGGRAAAELLWTLGDKTVELAGPGRAAPPDRGATGWGAG